MAADSFFVGGWVLSAPCEGAGPAVDAAGPAVL